MPNKLTLQVLFIAAGRGTGKTVRQQIFLMYKAVELMIFFVQYQAESKHDRNIKGAYINCWIKAANKSQAEASARKAAEEKKWFIIKTIRVHYSDENSYKADNEGLDYHKQAISNGYIMVFYIWTCFEKMSFSGKKTVFVPIR